MKKRNLLFSVVLLLSLWSFKDLKAQLDTANVIISEAFVGSGFSAYFELTNMGGEAVNLKNIEVGVITPWDNDGAEFKPREGYSMLMLDYELAPGESYLVVTYPDDFGKKQFALGVPGYGETYQREQLEEIADWQVHMEERNGIPGQDSVTVGGGFLGSFWGGNKCLYIRQHLNDTASVVLDQVGGVFDGDNGSNKVQPYDVAGVAEATHSSLLIRKFSVKKGNLDFAHARGIGEDDSEWIVVPYLNGEAFFRDVLWTAGNHGNYILDANTLESSVATIDFNAKSITVPWGTRRLDGVMHLMTHKPGLAWDYTVSSVPADSATYLAHTGDELVLTVAGNDGDKATFGIVVSAPTESANIVVPKLHRNSKTGSCASAFLYGEISWPRVSQNVSGVDSIYGDRHGIPYDTRKDSLIKYLDIPANASYELVWVDGVERANLKDGDILKVIAQNSNVKEYKICVAEPQVGHDAKLASITWPDITEDISLLYNWKGDTIPNFDSEVFDYQLIVPFDFDGIPALVAKTRDANTKVTIDRASDVTGPEENRTISFTVTAQDDTTINVYNVVLVKEKDFADQQPYSADPFITEFTNAEGWGTSVVEIVNPGNQPLDLSDYMVVYHYAPIDLADLISKDNASNWNERYCKYIPGRKWSGDESEWAATPYMAQTDPNVNPIIEGGATFVMGGVSNANEIVNNQDMADAYQTMVLDRFNVQFHNWSNDFITITNTWNEEVHNQWDPVGNAWNGHGNIYLFKIVNDSVKIGTKAALDPADFELIDVFGSLEGAMEIGGEGVGANFNYKRKPEIYKGNPIIGGSSGTDWETSEWILTKSSDYATQGYNYRYSMIMLESNMGLHYMNPVTSYLSTVTANLYRVSTGYSDNESIDAVITGTIVSDFLNNIYKADENQALVLKSGADGSELTGTDQLNNIDTLIVTSADGINTTKYVIGVDDIGLSNDAVLTSSVYTIGVNGQSGTISDVSYGDLLSDVLDDITVPDFATLQIIDGNNGYVNSKVLNYDTVYVDVTITDDIYLEVTAENKTTKILYQNEPNVSASDAFITSYVYEVDQPQLLVRFVPRGTSVETVLSKVIPCTGASVKVVDKGGLVRTSNAELAYDDKIVVTSQDGSTTAVYYISILSTETIPEGSYTAYILSDTYSINQLAYAISEVPDGETIAQFLGNITASTGATVVIVDEDGVEKTTGSIAKTDRVKVVSPSGTVVVYYNFGTATGIGRNINQNIRLYPNPTNGILNISGIEVGNTIKVYNIAGALVSNVKASGNISVIKLVGAPAGLYIIEISNDKGVQTRLKVIKK